MPRTPEQTRDLVKRFAKRYGVPGDSEGPVRFVREILKLEPDEWQLEALREYGRGGRRISIRACHGPGKTACVSWIIIHHQIFKFPQKTVATAPSSAQLNDALFAEVCKWMDKLPKPLQALFDVKADRIERIGARKESFFAARTARPEKPEALQGVHEENVLLIADEASGVHEAIFESAAGSMSGHNACTILLSNPTRTSGFFYDTHHKLKDMWYTIHVAAEDSTRVSDDFVEDIARRYGRDSDAFRIRVLGEFPKTDSDTVIPFELVETARTLDVEYPPTIPPIWGLDVARFGDDKCALVARNVLGLDPKTLKTWAKKDLMHTAGVVKRIWDETEPEERPSMIVVDVVGMGAGVADRLTELGLPVRPLNVSWKALDEQKYPDMRSELWFAAKEWLQLGTKAIPGDDPLIDELQNELVSVKFKYDSHGRERVEPKADMKARKLPSPNLADAFVLTFAEEAVRIGYGSAAEGGMKTLGFKDSIDYHRSIV